MHEKTAVIYARVSSAKQAEEELPISSQLEQCRQKAESLGAGVVKIYTDEGISGRSDSRPAFQDAILHCETEQTDYLVTWSSSRFARNKVDAGFYKKRLATAGVKIVYVSMEVDTDTTGGWLLDGVMEIFDELYSRQVSADTKRSLIKNAREGYWNGGRLPFGFSAIPDPENPKRKRLTANPDEAYLVKRIFELKADDLFGQKRITRWLNENGYTNRGRRWAKSTVQNLLHNESVIGKTVFGRKNSEKKTRPRDEWIIVDSHAPLIPVDLWDRVQEQLRCENNNDEVDFRDTIHSFTGLLRCGQCGSRMQTESATGRSRRYWYYNCSASALEKIHKPRRIPAGKLDGSLKELVIWHIFSKDNIRSIFSDLRDISSTWAKGRDKRLADAVSRISLVKKKQSNLYDLLELHGIDAPNLGDLSRRLQENNEKVKIIEQEIKAIESEDPPRVDVSESDVDVLRDALIDVVTNSEARMARAFLASFIDSVVIHDTTAEIVYHPQNLITGAPAPVLRGVVWLPDPTLLRTESLNFELPAGLHRKSA